MKIVCIGYRLWALKIYQQLRDHLPHFHFEILTEKTEIDINAILKLDPDFILFYGWSSVVDSCFIKQFKCIMLHPSKLPKFRGGSPIQNQIINGVRSSAVSLFLMDEKLDSGPILKQKELSLEGTLDEVFERISLIGYELTLEILKGDFDPKPQDESQATYYPRRTPDQSEITLDELVEKPAEYLFNKVRMLQHPYPLPYIITKDKKKLYIKSVSLDDSECH